MKKRLKEYIRFLDSQMEKPVQSAERKMLTDDLLIQISFFQHERLVHLIVTVTFALLSIITFLAALSLGQPALWALFFLFLVLLLPYIAHYYTLENGIQTLYGFYDKLKDNTENNSAVTGGQEHDKETFHYTNYDKY